MVMAAQTEQGRVSKLLAEAKEKMKAQVHRLQKKVEEADENTKHVVLVAFAAVEIGGVAFAFGWVRGYYGEKKVLGLPIEGWTAIGCHAVGLWFDFSAKTGKEGEWNRIIGMQFHNVGNGALAAWTHTMGAETGARMKEAKQQAQPATAGILTGAAQHAQLPGGTRYDDPMTQAELGAMAANL